jgi:hypothetical protein
MVKIYDCFMFNNEEDLLKLRIIEGLNYVEKFIIVESKQTHSGFNKSLYSDKMKDFFETYKDKIIHCIVEKFPLNINYYPRGLINDILKFRADHIKSNKSAYNNWLREGYQRYIISSYASKANGSDIFIVTDIDEIPNYAKIVYDISVNNNNILNEQINYTLPTYVYNIHYKLDIYEPPAAFTCPARLINANNINRMRFFDQKKCLDGYFVHLNRFLKPKELMIKEFSIAESNGINYSDEVIFNNMRKDILKNILMGKFNGNIMEYKNYVMPKNIHIISKLHLLNKQEINMFLKKIDDPSLDFEDTYNEIINL